jgi:DNA helicase HerA-like ATPase
MIQNAAMARADRPERDRVPVHLYVDEFETMATDRFEAVVAEGRRFGLSLTLSHQNLSQVPQGLRQVLRNNARTQLYFQTGAVDAADLAREIDPSSPRGDLQAALTSLGVGEAFLVRRGEPACRLRVPRSRDPSVSATALRRLRAVASASFGRPRAEAEAELRQREEARRRLSDRAAYMSRVANAAPGPSAYEVRHGKRDRVHPDPPRPV